MVKSIMYYSIKNNIKFQASLERIMKCGIGICDSCTINGYRVCRDGPVFSLKDLLNMSDLGKYTRLSSGKRIEL
ncbi:MAG: hypothetical protein QW746_04960 [Thermoplasmata archaeon]